MHPLMRRMTGWNFCRWVCFSPNINLCTTKNLMQGCLMRSGRETFFLFFFFFSRPCQFDIQVTHFYLGVFTLWLSAELREAQSPACQNQPGKLSQHQWRGTYTTWVFVGDTHPHILQAHTYMHMYMLWFVQELAHTLKLLRKYRKRGYFCFGKKCIPVPQKQRYEPGFSCICFSKKYIYLYQCRKWWLAFH